MCHASFNAHQAKDIQKGNVHQLVQCVNVNLHSRTTSLFIVFPFDPVSHIKLKRNITTLFTHILQGCSIEIVGNDTAYCYRHLLSPVRTAVHVPSVIPYKYMHLFPG